MVVDMLREDEFTMFKKQNLMFLRMISIYLHILLAMTKGIICFTENQNKFAYVWMKTFALNSRFL